MKDKTLILYCFHDFTNPNVANFVNLAKNTQHYTTQHYTFVFIYNGAVTNIIPYDIPFTFYWTGKNEGFDFGAYSKFILNNMAFIHNFEYFLFINSSVQLCIPRYVKDWVCLFTGQINELKGNMLAGSCINCASISAIVDPTKFSHVMSDIFCINLRGLLTLVMEGIFSYSFSTSSYDRVINKEIKMSRLFIEKYGWNITSLMKIYQDCDFRNISNDRDNYVFFGDVQYQNSYFGTNISPYEILAIKTNRNFDKQWLAIYH